MITEIYIVESDPFVRLDLEQLAALEVKGARITSVHDTKAAASALLMAGSQSCILINRDIAVSAPSLQPALSAAITRGARAIVLGREVALPFPATFVDTPFSSEMIIDAIFGKKTPGTNTPSAG